ncbi:MAG TPA: helix-turn-helix transcriptional regulator [Solirubrobacterales bacterium]
MSSLAPTAAHHRDELIARAQSAPTASEVFAEASPRLRRLVPYDSAIWLATDPETGMPTSPTRKENFHEFNERDCLMVWEREFSIEDVIPYIDLGRAPVPAGSLRLATRDRPARSHRFRDVLEPHGVGDELRVVMRSGDRPWAWLSLFREEGRDPFSADEVEIAAALSGPLANAIRRHARPRPNAVTAVHGRGPGMMVLSPEGEIVSVNDDALAWLEELPATWDDPTVPVRRRFELDLPILVIGTLMRARAVAAQRDHGPARARMRSPVTGRWLVCHASCLRRPDGSIGDTALVIEPALSSEVAPIIAHAYGLSRREQEITHLIARGLGTAAIAERLFLSAHTVRSYVKEIFEKVGVSSRGELVATLFAEHHAPLHLDPAGIDHAAFDD